MLRTHIDDQFSEASLIEDLPCVSECLDDRIFHDSNLGNKRKAFQRSDTSFSADMNGSLITLTPTCSITPTELDSPTKTLTPVTPINPIVNHFIDRNQFMNQQHQIINQQFANQILQRGRDEMPRNRQSIEAFKVPLSPSITLNDVDEQIADEQQTTKPIRKGSWTDFFRNRSKSTGGTSSGRSPTPSFSFFSPKQSSNQLNKHSQAKPKKRRMSSIFSFFNTFKKSTRRSLQDLSKPVNELNNGNLLSTNLDKVSSASSPNTNFDGYIKTSQIIIENNGETNVISLKKSFSSQQSVEKFVSQIEIVVKEKDEEFDKKMKEDIYLEEKILDEDIPIEKLERKMNYIPANQVNDLDKKEVLLKRTLKNRSDTLDEICSLPGRLPSFRRKDHSHANDTSQANDSSMNPDTNSESDDQATTITDQLSSKKTNYSRKNQNNAEVANLLEDEDFYNELVYKMELNNSPSRLKLQDKNERLNIKIIPIERPRSATPVNFASFETFINSSVNKEVDPESKIKLKLPEDVFYEMVNGRKCSPRKGSPHIWLDFGDNSLHTPKYNTRRNSNIEDQTIDNSQTSIEEAFTPSIGNSSTNETISEYLVDPPSQDNGFEDDFVNACLADLAHVIHSQQEEQNRKKNQLNESNKKDNQLNNQTETNYAVLGNVKQTFDQNNNLIVENLSCENCLNCENCKLNQILQLNQGQRFTPANETEQQLSCKCDCHNEKDNKNFNLQFSPKRNCSTASSIKNHQRRHSISSDISSASSRLICSSASSSSNSSRRISLRDDISNERLEA